MRVLVLAAAMAVANAQYGGYTYNPYSTPTNSFYYGLNAAGYFGTPFGYGSPYGSAPYPQTYQSPAYQGAAQYQGSQYQGQPAQQGQQQAQQQQPTSPWPAATAGSFTPVTCSTACVTPRACTANDNQYRSVDGSCNNLNSPTWGQAGMPYRRFASAKTSVNCSSPSVQLPNPRVVSTVTIARGDTDTSATLSLVMMAFSQFIDHDIELTPPRVTSGSLPDCCNSANAANADCCTIFAPNSDPFYAAPGRSQCMPFIRSQLTAQSAKTCSLGNDVMNANTAFLDLSALYGSDTATAKAVRAMSGGLLSTSVDPRGRSFPPITSTNPPTLQMGDARGDVHPLFTVLLTSFLRNHNRIASNLAKLHPDWSDEKCFQEAKKVNTAIYQNIVYNNFLPALLGPSSKIQPSNYTATTLYENWYDPNADPTISMPFSTAAYRLHTYVPSLFDLRDSNYNRYNSLLLRNVYHNFLVTVSNNTYDDLTRGMVAQPLNDFNGMFSPEVTEWIFPFVKSLSTFPPAINDFGADIVALNVQRGRDHMIQGYTTYRKLCSGIDVFSWSDLARAIPTDGLTRLAQVYGTNDPSTIDLYIGGVLESPVAGSDLGPTFFCLVQDQFQRLRSGDRFYYANPNVLTPAQLQAVRAVTLARVLCDNSDNTMAMALPRDVFRLPSQATNPIFGCTDTNNIPSFNIAPWT